MHIRGNVGWEGVVVILVKEDRLGCIDSITESTCSK